MMVENDDAYEEFAFGVPRMAEVCLRVGTPCRVKKIGDDEGGLAVVLFEQDIVVP